MTKTVEEQTRAIRKRTIAEAKWIVSHKCTLREVARQFEVGLTTVHNDLTLRLPEYSRFYTFLVRRVLDRNKRDSLTRARWARHHKWVRR